MNIRCCRSWDGQERMLNYQFLALRWQNDLLSIVITLPPTDTQMNLLPRDLCSTGRSSQITDQLVALCFYVEFTCLQAKHVFESMYVTHWRVSEFKQQLSRWVISANWLLLIIRNINEHMNHIFYQGIHFKSCLKTFTAPQQRFDHTPAALRTWAEQEHQYANMFATQWRR